MPHCFRSKYALAAALALSCTTVARAATDSRLIQAVRDGDVAAVRTLVQQRIDVNAPQGDGATALHWGAHVNDLQMADVLIRAGARAAVANDLGATPLHLACVNRAGPMVERLLSAGADANAATLNGETVLMSCARSGDARSVKALLVRGARVNARESGHQQTALMWAAANGHAEVLRLLIEAGADLRARSKIYPQVVAPYETQRAGREELNYTVRVGGLSPLFFAARSGDAESVRLLIAAGADPNDHTADGTTPLIMAAYSGRSAAATALVEMGADPNDTQAGYTALHAAILRSDLDVVKALLARGADPNLRMTRHVPKRRRGEDFVMAMPLVGTTPYLVAAKFLEPEMLRVLHAAGADVTLKMPNGATALMLAAGMDSIASESRRGVRTVDFGKVEPETLVLETVETVLSLGADVNASNRTGDTALHTAAILGHTSVVERLLAAGAVIDAKNARGLTPLTAALAARKGRGAASADGDDPVATGGSSDAIALLRKLSAPDAR